MATLTEAPLLRCAKSSGGGALADMPAGAVAIRRMRVHTAPLGTGESHAAGDAVDRCELLLRRGDVQARVNATFLHAAEIARGQRSRTAWDQTRKPGPDPRSSRPEPARALDRPPTPLALSQFEPVARGTAGSGTRGRVVDAVRRRVDRSLSRAARLPTRRTTRDDAHG
jgi:hypothetical protein